ncbi:amidohydrolase [Myxococcota bacterium]|nr:amidohydrolase [Myxococcota bacterium]
MREYRTISADSHINTPRYLYEEFAPSKFRSRLPVVESTDEGDFWVFEGTRRPGVVGLSAAAGMKPDEYGVKAVRFDEVRPGSWDTEARVADQDLDKIDAEVIYYAGMQGDQTQDLELRLVMYQAYNDWLASFVSGAADRLIGLAAIPVWDVETAKAETERAAKLGLRGAIIPSWSPGEPYVDPIWDPLWATFQDLSLPVSMHLGARPHWVRLDNCSPAYLSVSKITMAEPLSIMLLGGPLLKHPELKIVTAEAGIGWLAYMKEWMDNVYKRHRFWTKMEMADLPSTYFDRQVFSTFQEDRPGIVTRHLIGIDNIMWASDYPHSDTTWPNSQKFIDDQFFDVPADEREKIVSTNAAKLYGLA